MTSSCCAPHLPTTHRSFCTVPYHAPCGALPPAAQGTSPLEAAAAGVPPPPPLGAAAFPAAAYTAPATTSSSNFSTGASGNSCSTYDSSPLMPQLQPLAEDTLLSCGSADSYCHQQPLRSPAAAAAGAVGTQPAVSGATATAGAAAAAAATAATVAAAAVTSTADAIGTPATTYSDQELSDLVEYYLGITN